MSTMLTLFPKVRAEVLRLLFTDPERSLHLRELARLSGLAVGTLQTEVSKLRAAGFIQDRRDGNRLYYTANRAHPVFAELRGIVLKSTGLREQLTKALADLPGIALAFVFGSFATGVTAPDSDVDVFVIGGVGLRDLAPRLRPVAESLSREVNPTVMTADSFTRKAHAGDAFIRNVLAAPKLWITGNDDELGKLA
jgi:predicted nucleotidyltransferase